MIFAAGVPFDAGRWPLLRAIRRASSIKTFTSFRLCRPQAMSPSAPLGALSLPNGQAELCEARRMAAHSGRRSEETEATCRAQCCFHEV